LARSAFLARDQRSRLRSLARRLSALLDAQHALRIIGKSQGSLSRRRAAVPLGGRGSKRIQQGGLASEQDARVRRERRVPRSLTLSELVETCLTQRDGTGSKKRLPNAQC
jgi:hypothetical protein